MAWDRKEGDFNSTIFTRPKKEGQLRLILNLKKLNKSVEYHHFKIETLRQAFASVKDKCWFASLGLIYICILFSLDRGGLARIFKIHLEQKII